MTRMPSLVIGVLALNPLGATAQELGVDELVALALERSPALSAVQTEVDAMRGELTQAGLWPNPMVGMNHQNTLDGPGVQTMVEAQWPLELFRRPARVESATRAVAVTALVIADRERLLAAAVREQAGHVLEARRTLGVIEDLLDVNRQLRDLMEARVQEGALPRLDLDIVQVEVQRLEGQQALQAATVDTALIELRAEVGLEPSSSVVVRGTLDDAVRSAPGLDPEASVRVAIEDRPDVRAAAARISLADARLEQVRREGWLDASVVGAYGRVRMGFPQRAFGTGGELEPIRGLFNNLRVGVMVTLPLWDRNQGLVAAAAAERQRAQHEASASVLEASTEVAVAEARERAARRSVDLYAGAREQARLNLEVVQEAYGLGRTSLFDVLAEQQRYLDVESAFTDALSEAYQARAARIRATGEVE